MTAAGPGSDRPSSGEADFLETWTALLRRRWRSGGAIFAVVFGSVIAVLLVSRPVHRAEARLRLGEPPPMSGVSSSTPLLGFFNLGGDPFANDMELLRSRTLVEEVVEEAALTVTLSAPRGWHRDSLFARITSTRQTDSVDLRVTWLEDGRVDLRPVESADGAPGREVAPGAVVRVAGVTLVPREWRSGMPREVDLEVVPFGEAVRRNLSAIDPERVRREANVVEIAFDHSDPGVAEEVVRSVVDGFVGFRTRIFQRESGETVDSLRNIVEETAAELERAEIEMEELQRRTKLFAPEVQNEVFVERYGEVVGQLEQARLELAGIRNLITRVDGADDPASAWTELAAFPRFLEHRSVGLFLTRLTELSERRTELETRRTPDNREMQVLSRQISDLDRSLRSMAAGYEAALAEEISGLEAKVAEMDTTLSAFPGQALEMARLEREIRILSAVLVEIEQRLRQEEVREALTFANVQVIDPPELLHRPVWPRKTLGGAVGFLLAGTFGLLGMVVRERSDRGLRTADRIEEVAGAPVLAAGLGSGPELRFSDEEVGILFQALAENGRRPPVGVAAPPGGGDPRSVARVLGRRDPGDGSSSEGTPGEGISAFPDVRSPADVHALGRGTSVLLTVAFGRTRVEDLRRTAYQIRRAGGRIAGVVVVCRKSAEVRDVWR